jgi:hypothetical protein
MGTFEHRKHPFQACVYYVRRELGHRMEFFSEGTLAKEFPCEPDNAANEKRTV